MQVIEVETSIDQGVLSTLSEHDLEALINKTIRDKLSEKINTALDEMAYVDMEPDAGEGRFKLKASLVLCSTTDMETSVSMMAKIMHDKHLTEDDIGEILEPLMDSKGGF